MRNSLVAPEATPRSARPDSRLAPVPRQARFRRRGPRLGFRGRAWYRHRSGRIRNEEATVSKIHSTTILAVRRDGKVAVGGDGQVTLGQVVMKSDARKVRRLHN